MIALIDYIRFADGDGRHAVDIEVVIEDQPKFRIRVLEVPKELRLTLPQTRVLCRALERMLEGR